MTARTGADATPDTSTELMPAAFVGHGSPMNALERNLFTDAWRLLGRSVPRPRAILVVSAHWYAAQSAVTAMAEPPTIHDFYGFPEELFAVQYPAPGHPGLAEEVAELVRPVPLGLDRDGWGIDHGAWSVLVHLLPAADVPVVQLSIDAGRPLEYHVDLGARLAPLRRRGVLILGSGNVVHNLRRIDWSRPEGAYDWARRFDEAARDCMTTSPGRVLDLRDHPDYRHAVPTPDHFIPLLYLAGLAEAAEDAANVLVDGFSYGSISMTAYTLGVKCPEPSGESMRAAALPDPDLVPPDATNA